MRHFLNNELLAPNVMTAQVDPAIIAEFSSPGFAAAPGLTTIVPKRDKWMSDIRWVSAGNPETYAIFSSAFDRLNLAGHVRQYIDVDQDVRLYAGFLVIRSECDEPYFHVDWDKTNNEAFTAMMPVSAHGAGFGLLYENLAGAIGDYDYRADEAIIFGDLFSHSTKPGRSAEPVVLLCFEFGTDKMKYWDDIYASIGTQAQMLCRPDGQFVAGKGEASGH